MRDGCGEAHQIMLGLSDETVRYHLNAPSMILCAQPYPLGRVSGSYTMAGAGSHRVREKSPWRSKPPVIRALAGPLRRDLVRFRMVFRNVGLGINAQPGQVEAEMDEQYRFLPAYLVDQAMVIRFLRLTPVSLATARPGTATRAQR